MVIISVLWAIYPFSQVSGLAVGIGSAHRRFLWIVALALWTEGSQLPVSAQDTPLTDAAVSVPNPNGPTEKQGLLAAVERDIRTDPLKAPDVVARALGLSMADSTVFAGQVVQNAIHILLQPITRAQISALILAAVKARPAAVLEIVRVAVHSTPQNLHQDIVAAAVSGVPDPYSRGAGGKTLAESILDAAVTAGSGESRDALSAGINSSLGRTAAAQDPVANGTSIGTSATNGSEGSLAGNAASGGFGGATSGGGSSLQEDPLATPTPTSSPSPTPVTAPTPTPPVRFPAPTLTPTPLPKPTPDPTPFPQPTPTPVPVSP